MVSNCTWSRPTGSDHRRQRVVSMDVAAFALFGSRLDWIATILILAVGPVMISRLDRDDWLPGWLHKLSLLAVAAGLLTAVASFTNALATYGFVTVPVGMIWHLAAGIYFVKGRAR